MQCCAGICGGSGKRAKAAPAVVQAAAAALAEPKAPEVVSPIVPIGEPDPLPATSFEELVEAYPGLMLGPPGALIPHAAVTEDFPRNCKRLIVLVPSPGAKPGSWNADADPEVCSATPILRWAQANNYSAALFSSEALAKDAATAWDHVLRGSPASTVTVLAANGAMPIVGTALAPVHALLFNRFRTFCAPFDGHGNGKAAQWPPAWPQGLPKELSQHLAATAVRAPDAWRGQRAGEVFRGIFEMLALREERWQRREGKKYAGFQNMKENDMPGLKRLGLQERVERLDRDRGDDELARILKRNEKAGDSDGENEPGVD